MLPQPSPSALFTSATTLPIIPIGPGIVNPFFENSLPDRRKHRGNGQQYDGFLLREQPDGLYGITRAGNCESLKGEYLPMHQTGFGGEGSCIRKTRDAVKDPTSLVLSTKDYAASVPWVWPWRIRMASCNCKSLSSLREMGLEANSSGSSTTTSGSKPTPCQLRPCGE